MAGEDAEPAGITVDFSKILGSTALHQNSDYITIASKTYRLKFDASASMASLASNVTATATIDLSSASTAAKQAKLLVTELAGKNTAMFKFTAVDGGTKLHIDQKASTVGNASGQAKFTDVKDLKALFSYTAHSTSAKTGSASVADKLVFSVDANKIKAGDKLTFTTKDAGQNTAKEVTFTFVNGTAKGTKEISMATTASKVYDELITKLKKYGITATKGTGSSYAGKLLLNGNGADKTGAADTKNADVTIAGAGGLTLQIGDTSDNYNRLLVKTSDLHVNALGLKDMKISDPTSAAAIQTIKTAINTVSGIRGDLGAVQNRLEHTANNLSVMAENIQDAESTIRDTDVAEEMMAYTKNNILVQSAQAMLAQANAVPQGVLQLLG